MTKKQGKWDKDDNHFVVKSQATGKTTLYNVCAVPWGVFSTVGDIMSTVGDILSTVGVFSTVGDIMINVGISW